MFATLIMLFITCQKFLVCSNKKYIFPLGAGFILRHSSFLFSRWPTASQCSLEDHHCCKLNPFEELKEMHRSDQNLVAQYESHMVDHCAVVDW